MTSYISDLDIFPIVLIVIGVLLVTAVFIIDHYRKKDRNTGEAKAPVAESKDSEQSSDDKPLPSNTVQSTATFPPMRHAPELRTLDRKSSVVIDLLRVLLIPLSLIVAAGFLLILLPQSTTDKLIRELQSRDGASDRETIAFLYLGHQIQNDEFQIRGVVRNITTDPIEQLDAAVRLYSADGNLLETAIVRMDKESIDPDEIARFDLVMPNYQSEFSSYSVAFKFRQGEVVHYKDMRRQNDENLQ